MAHTRFQSDRGLTARMGFVIFLIGALYVSVMAGLIVFTSASWVVIVLIAAAVLFAQWYWSDKLALMAMGAREITPEQAPELHGIVDRMCALADMQKPRIFYSRMRMPNAFATGRDEKHSVICVTEGLLNQLNVTELEGVLAHELSHIAHRDVAVMTIASFLGVVAGLIFRWGLFFGGGGNRDNNALPVFLIVWVGSIVVYIISFLLTMALSRYREFAADRAAAHLTGNPSALSSALLKISNDVQEIPKQDLRKAEPASAFFFAPAFSKRKRGGLSSILSSHPTTEKRIEKLSEISAQLGQDRY